MNTAERQALRKKHQESKMPSGYSLCSYCAANPGLEDDDLYLCGEVEYPCDTIKVLDYLDLVDPHTEQSVQVEPENTEQNNCKHTQGHWLEVNGENYGFVLNFYCPKCGEKL